MRIDVVWDVGGWVCSNFFDSKNYSFVIKILRNKQEKKKRLRE